MSRLNTMESSTAEQPKLTTQQIQVISDAIDISHHLNPTADLNTLNPIRYFFCLEYFFSIYEEVRKVSNIERFLIFKKAKYVHSTVLINFLSEYIKEVGHICRRDKVIISEESIIDNMDQKTLKLVNRIWKDCYNQEIFAIPRQDVPQLIERIYTDLNINRTNVEVNKKIFNWKNNLSYYIIYEEYASLIRSINNLRAIKVKIQNKNCGTCTIF